MVYLQIESDKSRAERIEVLMAFAYSQDLRVRALGLIEEGMPISQVSQLLKISRPTLYRWLEQFESPGATAPTKRGPPPQESKIKDGEKFREMVDKNGDKTPKQLAQIWGNISQQAISRGLKKLGYTREKKLIVTRKDVNNLEGYSLRN